MNKKTFLFSLILLFLLANIFSFAVIKVKTGTNLFKNNEYLNKKKTFFIKDAVDKYIHPFIGQIDLNNVSNVENNLSDEKLFYHVYESKIKNNNETIKILLLGSSVAINFSDNTNNAYDLNRKIPHKTNKNYNILVKKIEKYFPEKNIIFYNAATRSSKQPQQLFKLYYLYLIGMEFDIVINFDGPLEIAHPYLKNYPIGDELIYPRRYSDDLAILTRDITCVEKNNKEVEKNSFIPVLELYSYLQIRSCNKMITKREGKKNNWKNYTSIKERNEEEVIQKSFSIWKNSSLEIQNFAKNKKFFLFACNLSKSTS